MTIDRRREQDRRDDEAGVGREAVAAAPKLERRKKVNRRRQIDPTTCERDYTDQEVEFMNALDDYKRKSGRMFPTCSEVLEVIHSLGYVKLSPAEMTMPATMRRLLRRSRCRVIAGRRQRDDDDVGVAECVEQSVDERSAPAPATLRLRR